MWAEGQVHQRSGVSFRAAFMLEASFLCVVGASACPNKLCDMWVGQVPNSHQRFPSLCTQRWQTCKLRGCPLGMLEKRESKCSTEVFTGGGGPKELGTL
jgi:hypothetical protein